VPPNLAVSLLTLLAVLGAAAVLSALALVVAGGVIGHPHLFERLAWCRLVLVAGHRASWPVAGSAGVMLLVGLVRAVRFDVGWRRTVQRYQGLGGVDVLASPEQVAFAAPGKPGTVVVSEGLLDLLDDDESAAVIAHERAHLVLHHARYLRVAGLAAAAVPPLLPLSRQLRFATERAADEGAAVAVGDRRVVARAIARVALATSPMGVLAVGGSSVAARVAELVDPPRPRWLPVTALLAAVVAAVATVLASTIQVHHLVGFATHVCGLR